MPEINTGADGAESLSQVEHSSPAKAKRVTLRQFNADTGEFENTSSSNPIPVATQNALVTGNFDFIGFSNYSGANPQTIEFKSGGSGGTTIATLSLVYSGDNVTSITKTQFDKHKFYEDNVANE